MAESVVQVNEGTGKKLHTFQRTIGANNVEDEVVIAGEPYLASYEADGSATNATTANSHMLQLMAGATLKVYVRRIIIYQGVTLAGAATAIDAQIWRVTTAGTGGGAVAIPPRDPADVVVGATAQTLPTVKGTEATMLRRFSFVGQAAAPVGAEGTKLWEWNLGANPRSKALVIAAGTANGIVVKNITALAAATFHVVIEFDEANF